MARAARVAEAKLLEHEHVAAAAGELVRRRETHDSGADDHDIRLASHPHILLYVTDARRALLTGLIDDAGLFPPASLSMADALAGHFDARAGDDAWLLARFLCPASRIDELAEALPADETLRLGIVLDTPALPDVERLPALVILETLEARVPDEAEAERLPDVPTKWFFEAPTDVVPVAARRQAGMKIRCGGPNAGAFPPPADVASFIHACRAAGVQFKATAGLHQPFRHVDPETGFTQHGFLNLLTAAALDVDETELTEVLADEDASDFALDQSGLRWRDRVVDAEACERTRRFFIAYGSCSFSEPVEALKALDLL
jgi:hypothetical protein